MQMVNLQINSKSPIEVSSTISNHNNSTKNHDKRCDDEYDESIFNASRNINNDSFKTNISVIYLSYQKFVLIPRKRVKILFAGTIKITELIF